MSLRRGRGKAELMGDINVVSLIDVMMLLLVIFMITAPIMQGGVDVQLPTADTSPLEPDKNGLIVSVTRDSVYIGSDAYTMRSFTANFRAFAASHDKKSVYVRADSRASIQQLFDVWTTIQKAGIQSIGMMATPQDAGR